MLLKKSFKRTISTALVFLSALTAQAQDPSQLGFSDLQAQANALVESGELSKAMPFLKELIRRVEATDDSDIELDFPLFLLGTAYIQQYVSSGKKSDLTETLRWYDKLEKEYPNSRHLKEALLKKADVLRAMDRLDDAIKLMQSLISGAANQRLTYSEQIKLLKDLTQSYYGTGKLKEGLPYFQQLFEVSRDAEEKALGAAASFEAFIEAKRYDDAIKLLPALAKESEVRYRPRLNVALLKASDALVEQERLNDAALLLNLTKTTDLMIEYNENQLAQKKARKEQREAFGNAEEEVEKLTQEIKTIETNLAALRKLPTLRNELLVRRARNYTKTSRSFEAFWMFYDLMVENPNDKQIQFFYYATFSNALQLAKREAAVDVGRDYRAKFPNGDFYADVSSALAITLKEMGENEEFVSIVVDFLNKRPLDPASGNLFGQWASFLMEEERYEELIKQASTWEAMHSTSVFTDGIHYWKGMAELQTGLYADTIVSMDKLLTQFPTSLYAEDGLLRKGTAQFYNQLFEDSRDTLLSYTTKYPNGPALDQAYFFLGEIEFIAANYEVAMGHFEKADELTTSQDIHDTVAFRIGSIYESIQEYEKMAEHFTAYMEKYPNTGRLADAVFELGRAYEFTQRPVEMLALYAETIDKYLGDPGNAGVDALVESYAEKYNKNYTMLTQTVAMLDMMENDMEFREKVVMNRGFLFELFYLNQQLDQPLYNRMRFHPNFTAALLEDLSPIDEITSVYGKQLEIFPSETPEDFYRELLAKAQSAEDRIGEVRALMGLFRIGIEVAPKKDFDGELLSQLSPRALLYIADYAREKNLEYAIAVWNEVLESHKATDSAIVALMRMADVSNQRGDKNGALGHLDQIVEQFPGSPKVPGVILRQGELLTEMSRTEDARVKYQYILRVPDWRGVIHARALYQTGQSYMEEDEYAKAHGFFERTFLGYSHFTEWTAKAYLEDAEALVRMGVPQDAITTLKEALELLGADAAEELIAPIRAKLQELQS